MHRLHILHTECELFQKVATDQGRVGGMGLPAVLQLRLGRVGLVSSCPLDHLAGPMELRLSPGGAERALDGHDIPDGSLAARSAGVIVSFRSNFSPGAGRCQSCSSSNLLLRGSTTLPQPCSDCRSAWFPRPPVLLRRDKESPTNVMC